MARAAVIVVDMQRGLLQRAKPAHRLDEVVAGINRLTAAARPAGAPRGFGPPPRRAAHPVGARPPGWRLPAARPGGVPSRTMLMLMLDSRSE